MNIPENLKYTKEHEFVKMDGNTATVGITDYAQSELGDIIFVDFTKSPGDEVSTGDVVCSIEAVKTVSEVFSPLSGKITEVNSGINDAASSVNSDPYGAGWLFKMEVSNPAEVEALMSAADYKGITG